MNFYSRFIEWIHLLYTSPVASVVGCPLSPLLFTIAIEPLSLILKLKLILKVLNLSSHYMRMTRFFTFQILYYTSLILSMSCTILELSQVISWISKSECMPVDMHGLS